MKTFKTKAKYAILLAAFLGSACSTQKVEQYQLAFENPHKNEVEIQDFRHVVSFGPSAEMLSEGEKQALDYFLYSENIGYGDALYVDVNGNDPAWNTKMDAINNFLKTRGLWAKQAIQTGDVSDASTAALVVNRYTVIPPDCKALSEKAFVVSTDAKVPLHGCITAHNLGVMVANPADLIEGQPDTLPEAYGAVKAILLYRENYASPEKTVSAQQSLIEALFGGG